MGGEQAMKKDLPSSLEKRFAALLEPVGIKINGNRPWDIKINDSRVFVRALKGSLGAGESYMDGDWDCERLDEFFFRIFSAGLDRRLTGKWRLFFSSLLALILNLQSPNRAFAVGRHYDTGNLLFKWMLGERMIYSCGYWKNAATLEEAQEAKLELICQKLGLKQGMRLLDIGCGWGGLLKYAAQKYGVKGMGITISEEQAKLARDNCASLDVEIAVQDYRQLAGKFDRIVSVGMFEHVGYKNYRTYMKTAHNCLKDGGLFLLHTIGKDFSAETIDLWIKKYIFPNSMLPSLGQITMAAEKLFVAEDVHNFGADYDRTLMCWHKNFSDSWDLLEGGYGVRFRRMWTYYLLASAALFRSRKLQVWQIVFSKGGVPGGYQSIR